ncbi:hypothetical protein [Streptomyces sp. NPDC093149]|uniref:effector-associated constant component EACC1 n=1 Tax=Streptomyces sp. NPDC093149 TaxID=3366031 RepID=UPI0037F97C02
MASVILVSGSDGGRVPDDLRRFLLRDPAFRPHGRPIWRPASTADEGHLGTALDVLTLVITGALALPSAIETVHRWCITPGWRSEQVSLTVGDVTVTVSASTSAEEIAAMVAALAIALEAASAPASSVED